MLKPLLICITNIPSSYRIDEFNYLYTELTKWGILFEAVFMAESENGRFCKYSPSEYLFQSHIEWGMHIGDLHFNPNLLGYILKKRPSWLVIGGGWLLPTTIFLSIGLKIINPKLPLLFWTEGSVSYTKFSSDGWKQIVRKFFLNIFDGFVVPGEASIQYLNKLDLDSKTTIKLSNFIEPTRFFNNVRALRAKSAYIREQYKINNSDLILLLPARLIPEKGILEYLYAIRNFRGNFRILIAGEGPLQKKIEAIIDKYEMINIVLLGNKNLEGMIDLFAVANVLLLPSIRETYSFVCVEALWAGLPLLMSKNIGASPEVLVEDINGWSFDCFSQAEIINTLFKVTTLPTERIKQMGEMSVVLAQNNFDCEKSSKEFCEQLFANFPPNNIAKIL
jgi:hypothetical protein